jgi:hypothetical protein
MSEIITLKTINENNPVMNILSFGCSFGEEVKVFEEKYFRNHGITGVDINEDCIKKCKELGLKSTFCSMDEFKGMSETYDVVFAMSVLCTMVHNRFEDPIKFNDFDDACVALDKKINVGGYFVDFNSNYYFLDSIIGFKYIPISHYKIQNSNEQTIKYEMDGRTVKKDNAVCIFKKIK